MSLNLYHRYLLEKQQQPHSYARDLAAMLGVSEAELTAARVGHDAVRLADNPKAILAALADAGELKAITRNAQAVHEVTGAYLEQQLDGHVGLLLNPGGVDLRLFFSQWHSAFALCEETPRGPRHSLQFFNRHGEAVHKIYATAQTNMTVWQQLLADFQCPESAPLALSPVTPTQYANEVDTVRLEQEWRAMTDVHQFYLLLHRHRLSRQQAFNHVSDELAQRVDNQALPRLLDQLQQQANPIMIFVANSGCVQIFTGRVQEVSPLRGWLNIFNPNFTLHLKAEEIAESWITRKPTVDGIVTSLELFAADGTQIAQLFGQRQEGEPEQPIWREQLTQLLTTG